MTWIIDAHCHLDDSAYDADRKDILARLPEEGVLALVNPGCDLESSQMAMEMARENPRVFACLGNHPERADQYGDRAEDLYRAWAKEDRVVAIGEIGLDYHYEDNPPREVQKKALERQLSLAEDLGLPAVVHCRDAAMDTYEIVKKFAPDLPILMHSFNEKEEIYRKFEGLGCYFSIGGMVTFKNTLYPKELAKTVDLSRLLLETDCPYLAPLPYRGKRNLPSYAHYSLKKIAEIREIPLEDLAVRLLQNTGRFFSIEKELRALEAES